MASLFISYSRRDLESARKLTESFTGQELDFWIDWEGIEPTVDWWLAIEKGIEEADVFLFLISPDSCKSSICEKEILHAVKNGKRLIPIVIRDVKADDVPAVLRPLNWIFLRTAGPAPLDDFDSGLAKLLKAIHTDYAWVQFHRRLQVKALEWDRSDSERSLLLRGKDLQDAETQLARNASKEPQPTDAQREYVLYSRRASDRQRRITMGIAVAGVIALAVLAIFGFVQAGLATQNAVEAQENADAAEAASTLAFNNAATAQANAVIADERANIARAGELVTVSMSQQDEFFSRSLLLGIEAIKTYRNPRTETALFNLSNTNPNLIASYAGSESSNLLGFYPDDKTILAVTTDGKVTVWGIDKPNHPVQFTSLVSNSYYLYNLTLSVDRKLIASSDAAREVTLWDITNPEQPSHVSFETQHADAVASFAFSPDGKLLASGSYGRSLILWDIRNPAFPVELCNLSGPDMDTNTVAFHPDGGILATTGGNTVILWDVSNASHPVRISMLTAHSGTVETVAFSRDGSLMASGGFDDKIIVWDITDPADPIQKSSMSGSGSGSVTRAVAFSPDGQTLATSSSTQPITLWDIQDPTNPILKDTLTGDVGLDIIFFSPDGQHLVSNGDAIHLWDVDQPSSPLQVAKVSDPQRQIYTIAFHPTEKLVAARSCKKYSNITGCSGDEIVLWNIKDPTEPKTFSSFPMQSTFGNDIAFRPGGLILAAAGCITLDADHHCTQAGVELWDIQDPSAPKFISTLPQQGSLVSSIAFRPDGNILVLAGCQTDRELHTCLEGQIVVWNIEDSANPIPVSIVPGQYDIADSLAFSPDGNTIASSGCRLEGPGCAAGEILLWDMHDIKNPKLITTLSVPSSQVGSIAFSRDNSILVLGGNGSELTVWDVHDPHSVVRLSTLAGHSGIVYGLALSLDSQYLVSGSCANYGDANFCTQGEIILWDVSNPINPAHLVTWLEHGSSANSVSFDMSSTLFASASDDGSMVFWDIEPSFLIENTCKRASRNLSVDEWTEFFPREPYRVTCPDVPIALEDQLEIVGYSLSIQDEKTSDAIYEQIVRDVEQTLDPDVLNQVCWYGGLDGYAELVLPLCDRAVELATLGNDPSIAAYRDSRGLVRALTGDVQGALEDFSAYVESNKGPASNQNLTRQREAWILALQSGENPFTTQFLLELRVE